MTQSGNSGTDAPMISQPGRRMAKGSDVDKNKDSSVKETLESILVAFILAFIFRAFVVEAFVIPTGSMAPTLLGAHMRFHCNDCGYRFTANYSAPSNRQGDLIIKDTADIDYHVYCPNCGYKFPMYDPADPDNDGSKPPVHYGDRILVLKYLYLFEHPQRWDVVVFKSPANDDPTSDKPTYQQNYIKRLIGRPGESIMILTTFTRRARSATARRGSSRGLCATAAAGRLAISRRTAGRFTSTTRAVNRRCTSIRKRMLPRITRSPTGSRTTSTSRRRETRFTI
jgi:signal peptidase I